VQDETRAKILIVGAGGRLGAALLREYGAGHAVSGFARAQLDVAEAAQLRRTVTAHDFEVLINCAAQTNVDRCETEQAEAFAINAEAPRVLAEICNAKGARLIQISTDYVFDGEQQQPYREEDEPRPISVYGASKHAGDQHVLASGADHVVARVSWVFGPDRPSFLDAIIKRARAEEKVEAIADKISTPSYTLDIAEMLRLFLGRATSGGIYHLTNDGACSWQEYGQWALDCCHAAGVPLRTREVGPLPLASMKNFIARRPIFTALATDKYARLAGGPPRPWRDAVAAYVREHIAPRAQV